MKIVHVLVNVNVNLIDLFLYRQIDLNPDVPYQQK